ncbi:hypothetical protein [Gracilimonas tropica]|uniref:hypothetical protein n=1 Tax=Gracilimonas tropica TaxID=454600 RepID=UPI00036E27E9|nr:hypothetical protein [Gracilimonas tropica]
MKNLRAIFLLLLFCLSGGQGALGFSGLTNDLPKAEIQPVHSSKDEQSYPSSSGYLIELGSQSESVLFQSNRLKSGFGESETREEEDIREWVNEARSKRKGKLWLYQAGIIERSLTFRELIYPHHFYF